VKNAQKPKESSNNDIVVVDEITAINIADFDDKAGDFVDKKFN